VIRSTFVPALFLLFSLLGAHAFAEARTLTCVSPGSRVARQDIVDLTTDGLARVVIGLRTFGDDGGFAPICRSTVASYEENSVWLSVRGELDCGEEGHGPYELFVNKASMRTEQGHACAWN